MERVEQKVILSMCFHNTPNEQSEHRKSAIIATGSKYWDYDDKQLM